MLAVLLFASALTTAEVVPLPQPLVWAREPSKLSFAETANGGCRVESSAGAEDWVVRCTDRTPVKPGEIYAFSVRVSAEKLEEGLTSSAELRDEHGVVLDWQHAMKPLPKTGVAVNVFVVPPPRISNVTACGGQRRGKGRVFGDAAGTAGTFPVLACKRSRL